MNDEDDEVPALALAALAVVAATVGIAWVAAPHLPAASPTLTAALAAAAGVEAALVAVLLIAHVLEAGEHRPAILAGGFVALAFGWAGLAIEPGGSAGLLGAGATIAALFLAARAGLAAGRPRVLRAGDARVRLVLLVALAILLVRLSAGRIDGPGWPIACSLLALGAAIALDRLRNRLEAALSAALILQVGQFAIGAVTAAGLALGLLAATLPLLMLLFALIRAPRTVAALNAQLEREARLDGLTGIANRRSFDRWLDREWRRAARQGRPLSLLMIDIDRFKSFNDRYGHVAGDDALRRVADAIAQAARRAGDLAARYGGEEFAVILPETAAPQARMIADRIRDAIAALAIPHAGNGERGIVTVSVGVATLRPAADQSATGLVEIADAALFAAKRAGRDQVMEMAS